MLAIRSKHPLVVDRTLWEKSGHWDKYRENMFITEIDEEHANEKRVNALKPMNCPCHVQIFNKNIKSYRDLPIESLNLALAIDMNHLALFMGL